MSNDMEQMAARVGPLVMSLRARSDGLSQRAATEIERLRALCLPEFEGEIAVKLMRVFSPNDGLEWVCHWWPIEGDAMSQRYGEGITMREAILAAMKERSMSDERTALPAPPGYGENQTLFVNAPDNTAAKAEAIANGSWIICKNNTAAPTPEQTIARLRATLQAVHDAGVVRHYPGLGRRVAAALEGGE